MKELGSPGSRSQPESPNQKWGAALKLKFRARRGAAGGTQTPTLATISIVTGYIVAVSSGPGPASGRSFSRTGHMLLP